MEKITKNERKKINFLRKVLDEEIKKTNSFLRIFLGLEGKRDFAIKTIELFLTHSFSDLKTELEELRNR